MCENEPIRKQAEALANANREAEPTISDVYWFPHEHEVRLVEIDTLVPSSPDGKVHPFHFRPAPGDDLPAPSDVALIHPDEFRNAELPPDWGTWDDAEKL